MSNPVADVAIVGGGIVGLATGMECLARCPGRRLIVLEKEPRVASHQTAHNSGVIHSGLYYPPGSVKAATCVAGARLMIEFCQQHHIPYQRCGKLIVAVEEAEVPALERLSQQGLANGVAGLALVDRQRMREIEPHARGVKGLHVPGAAVVDFSVVAETMADVIRQRGGVIQTSTRVQGFLRRDGRWVLDTTQGEIRSKFLVTCGGLYADRLGAMAGVPAEPSIVPFRGEYYELIPQRRFLVQGMIYPVPSPGLPFLGVHLTRTIHGRVQVGPNAVLALAREGYQKTDLRMADLLGFLRYPGFWKMAWRYWSVGVGELYRSWRKAAFVRAVQRLVPAVQADDLVPGGSGVRAQAVDRHGSLVDDFRILEQPQALHVCHAPSPAATAAIRIGQLMALKIH